MTDSQQIPQQWLSLQIGEIAEVVGGGTPKAGDPDNFAEPGTQIPWLTPADLSKYSEKYISHGSRDLSKEGYEKSSAKLMPSGTLLFSSRAPIGYVAIAENEISTNQGFKNFVLPTAVDPSYGYYFLRSIRDVAESVGTGTTFKEISGANAKKLPFYLAPLAEQKVIADKLDTLLTQVENTKARLERIPQILKRFRQSVLAAAVSGRLTEEFTATNKGYYQNLDKDIGEDRKLRELPPPSKDELDLATGLFENPDWKHWRLYSLEQLIESARGIPYGIVQTGEAQKEGIPTIRCGDVKPLHVDTVSLKKVHPSIEEKYTRTRLRGGEVILAIRGTVGNAAVVSEEMATLPLNISREVAMIPVREDVSPHYIAILLQSPGGFRSLAEKTKGVAQRGINLADVKRLVTPLPTLNEQTEIVRRVDQLFAHADRIEQQVSNALARVNKLTQSILAKAFRGELTEQWRKDNPGRIRGENSAEKLLEKIKEERAAIGMRPKPKRAASKRKTGSSMSKQTIKVVEALKQANEPLSGQQLLVAAGYSSDSSTEELEEFFLDLRESLTLERSIVKIRRTADHQDWFALADSDTQP